MNYIVVPFVFFALRRESTPFLKMFRARDRLKQIPFRAWRCLGESDAIVVETGLGMKRSAGAMTWLLGYPAFDGTVYQPSMAVAAGFAGALTDDLTVGDVILADEVVDEGGGRWPTWAPPHIRTSYRAGRLVTVSRLVSSASEKMALRNTHQAIAVDMESAAVARICSLNGIHFYGVRSISDDARTELSPSLLSLLADGRVSVPAVLGKLAVKPSLAFEMWKLARDTRVAARELAVALHGLLLQH